MNRGEAGGISAIAGCASIIVYYAILYFLVFDNFLIVAIEIGYDLYSVESQVWWLMVGFGFILAMRTITKSYKWMRRDYCNHCGKELRK
jgi:membrane protein YdbS with pleckstrin-like domain